MSDTGDEFVSGNVSHYDEQTKQTPLGTLYRIKFDVEVSSPDDLTGLIHVLMEGYDKTGTLEDDNYVQFDRSKSEFNGNDYKINAVQNVDTLKWFKVFPREIPDPPDDGEPDNRNDPPKIPAKLIILGVIASIAIVGAVFVFSLNGDSDGDGIFDSEDNCKNMPENYNGYEDHDGCPDKKPNSSPVAKILILSSPAVGSVARFSGSTSSDRDGTIMKYSWNFGDGTSSSMKNPSHVYSTAGTKTVKLTVTDNNGASHSTSKSVRINPAEILIEPGTGSSVPGCDETNECYIPYAVVANVGEKITFSNTDSAVHTFTSGNTIDGPDGVFDSSLVMAGSSFEWFPATIGEQPYFCIVHPWMTGIITIK